MENKLILFEGNKGKFYCSKKEEKKNKRKNYLMHWKNVMLLNDCVGQEIEIQDIYCEPKQKSR